MKFDSYTKGVLTVIAICLVLLTFKNLDLLPTASAEGGNSYSKEYGLVPLNEDGSIDVHVTSINPMETIDVNIDDISTSDKLNINLSSASSMSLQFAGPIQVTD